MEEKETEKYTQPEVERGKMKGRKEKIWKCYTKG